jgi:Predicted membrane protein (DUF2232)
MKRLAEYIVRGRWQAVQVVVLAGALTWLLPPLSSLLVYLATAALALVTLYVGVLAGLQVLLLASTVLMVLFELTGQHLIAVQTLLVVLLLWVPGWLIAAVLQQTRGLGHALRAAALFGCCALLAIYGYFGDPVPWWIERLKEVVSLLQQNGVNIEHLGDATLLQEIAALMTGMLVSSLLVGVSGSLLLARWWQSLLVRPGAFREEFCALRLGTVYGLVTLGVMLFAELSGSRYAGLATQLGMVSLVPFLLAGLAVIHSLVRQTGRGSLWLVLVYVLLALLPQTALLLAGGGLMDTWIDFRRRLARPGSNHNKDM